jgi:hypothetical protein
VLVVVDVVPRVAMVAVDVVEMVLVGDRRMAAAVLVHVHVPRVRNVEVWSSRGVREHAVQVVHVVLVRYRGVAAEAIVDVSVQLQRPVGSGVGHRYLRAPR